MTDYVPGTKLRTKVSSVVVTKSKQLYEIRRNGETTFYPHSMWDTVEKWLEDTYAGEEDLTIEPPTKSVIPRGKMAKWTYDQRLCAENIITKPPSLVRKKHDTRKYLCSQIEHVKDYNKKYPTFGGYYSLEHLTKLEEELAHLDAALAKFPELGECSLGVRRKTRFPFIQTVDDKMFPIYFHLETGVLGTGNSQMPKLGRTFKELGIESPKTLWVYTDKTFTELKAIPYSP